MLGCVFDWVLVNIGSVSTLCFSVFLYDCLIGRGGGVYDTVVT